MKDFLPVFPKGFFRQEAKKVIRNIIFTECMLTKGMIVSKTNKSHSEIYLKLISSRNKNFYDKGGHNNEIIKYLSDKNCYS